MKNLEKIHVLNFCCVLVPTRTYISQLRLTNALYSSILVNRLLKDRARFLCISFRTGFGRILPKSRKEWVLWLRLTEATFACFLFVFSYPGEWHPDKLRLSISVYLLFAIKVHSLHCQQFEHDIAAVWSDRPAGPEKCNYIIACQWRLLHYCFQCKYTHAQHHHHHESSI